MEDKMISILAESGCTLLTNPNSPPTLPSDPHTSAAASTASSPTPPTPPSSPTSSPASIPTLEPLAISADSSSPPLRLRKASFAFSCWCLPSNCACSFSSSRSSRSTLKTRAGFVAKLVDVISICPLRLKKEIIGSLPEMIGDQSNGIVVDSLRGLLEEDSEIIVPVLDTFSNLNLDDQQQEQVVTVALSCIRTVDFDHMPYLLRFLMLSATLGNARRIISQVREHLKFVSVGDFHAARGKKLKGKSSGENAEGLVLEALRSGLQFKNNLCQEVLKELKSLDKAQDHKVVDIWLLVLIYTNGGSLQKVVEKILKKKILDDHLQESLFDLCIHGHRELIQILGALVAHIGSGISYEVGSSLDTMALLARKYADELLPLCSHINGILDYLEGFNIENLHKVYEVFSLLSLSARSNAKSIGFSFANELLMIVRKQVSSPDLKYKKMGLVGALKIVSYLGNISNVNSQASSQVLSLISFCMHKNCEESLELLKASLESCKLLPLPSILFHDELINLLESTSIHPTIMEWIGKHVGDFESIFLSDLEGGSLLSEGSYWGLEGQLWMNLDGGLSPICVNIFPLVSASTQGSPSLQVLPAYFLLLSVVERLTNQGSLGGIDALLGCPLHLPAPKYFVRAEWLSLHGKQKEAICLSLYYAVNWIRELLNAFCTQISGRVHCVSQATKEEIYGKLLKRLRNLVLLESLLNASLKLYPVPLPELNLFIEHSWPSHGSKPKHGLMEKKHERPILPEKDSLRKKHKRSVPKGASATDKLKQPTILDMLKKAGVVSQEVPNEEPSSLPSSRKVSQPSVHDKYASNDPERVEISAAASIFDVQKLKCRPLLIDCFSIFTFSEVRLKFECCHSKSLDFFCHYLAVILLPISALTIVLLIPLYWFHNACRVCCILCLGYVGSVGHAETDFILFELPKSCCSDPAAELPLLLYLLRDLSSKLSYLIPQNKHFQAEFSRMAPGLGMMETSEFLCKTRQIFPSMKKQLNCSVHMLREAEETCEDHWESRSSFAGNPVIPNFVMKKSSVAGSVFKEVLSCFSKILNLAHVQRDISVLSALLEAFQQNCIPDVLLSENKLVPGNIDYIYLASSISILLTLDVLSTLESVVISARSYAELSNDRNKSIQVECVQKVLPLLCTRLGTSAQKLLMQNLNSEDHDDGWKSKGETIQKILHIYIENSESAEDLLVEFACSILPEMTSDNVLLRYLHQNKAHRRSHSWLPNSVPINTHSMVSGAGMRCSYYERNLAVLNKLVKEASMLRRPRANAQVEPVKGLLTKLRQSVNVVVSLVNLCKTHDKILVHAMAVKHGGKYVDSFIKVFDFLQVHFESHGEVIIQLVKELQKATRIMQTLCSEAKGSRRTAITSRIPATKRSMERFLFQVKGLLHNTSSGCTFWMGNLKHKDLLGQVVSSQLYANDDDDDEEAEGDADNGDATEQTMNNDDQPNEPQ
ncbi:hypothetical protein Syun_028381 [Stephania yunnanensis]|uniref:Fanconi anemia group D2 protein n=1 Tax=Stephania yunnanensis TaxID=152371 RepID=A0AAP0EJS7_9MAGN